MSEDIARIHPPDASISEEALKRAEEMIEQEEGVQNKFSGAMAAFIICVAVTMSLFHLYASYAIVRTEVMRATHVAFVLFLSSLIFPISRRFRHRGRRVVLAHHPLHHLRRLPAVLRRRQVLYRFLVLGDGRQAHRRRAHGGAGVVPARRSVRLWRCDDGDVGLGRLPDARQGGL